MIYLDLKHKISIWLSMRGLQKVFLEKSSIKYLLKNIINDFSTVQVIFQILKNISHNFSSIMGILLFSKK